MTKAAVQLAMTRPRAHLVAAALLCIGSIALWWPGIASYDSVVQYAQVLAHAYDDWHPPIMARLWALTDRIWRGAAPMLVLQMLGWWGGLGLIAGALARTGRARWASGVLALGLFPPMLGWLGVVIKDGQMLAATTAAVGLVAWWRLRGARVPWGAAAAAAVLLGYATLVRANAPFATVPLALALGGWPGARGVAARAALGLAATAAVIVLAGPVNQDLLGAARTHVERTLPLYDLAGIAHYSGAPTIPGLPPGLWRAAEARRCYGPLLWDAYGDGGRCSFVGERLAFGEEADGTIFRTWLVQAATHPLAYLRHRIGHLDRLFRFVVAAGEPNASAPMDSEPGDLGLGKPGRGPHIVGHVSYWVAASPLGWPVMWVTLAVGAATAAFAARGTPGVALARALLISSLAASLSFAAVSIAPDLRYHLWAMAAAGLAALLLGAERAVTRAQARWTGAALGVVAAIGTAARLFG